MPPTTNLRQITHLVSEGTGLTPDEVRWWGALTASVAVGTGVLYVIQAVRRLISDLGDG